MGTKIWIILSHTISFVYASLETELTVAWYAISDDWLPNNYKNRSNGKAVFGKIGKAAFGKIGISQLAPSACAVIFLKPPTLQLYIGRWCP
jgi:hypothetical protein